MLMEMTWSWIGYPYSEGVQTRLTAETWRRPCWTSVLGSNKSMVHTVCPNAAFMCSWHYWLQLEPDSVSRQSCKVKVIRGMFLVASHNGGSGSEKMLLSIKYIKDGKPRKWSLLLWGCIWDWVIGSRWNFNDPLVVQYIGLWFHESLYIGIRPCLGKSGQGKNR